MTSSLVKQDKVVAQIARARKLLAEINTPQAAKIIAAEAVAMRLYMERIGASQELIDEATDIQVEAEARLDLLRAREKKGGRPAKEKPGPLGAKITRHVRRRGAAFNSVPREELETGQRELKEKGNYSASALAKTIQRRKRDQSREACRAAHLKAASQGAKGCGQKIGPFECCSVVRGDMRELLPCLPSASVSAVITDPPYGVELDAWDDRVPYELIRDFLRVTVGPVAWLGPAPKIIEAAKSFSPSPERVLIWFPSFTLSHVAAKGIAYRFHLVYVWNIPQQHLGPTWDVIDARTETGNWWAHPCTKPLTLMRQLCLLATDEGVILDPFAGSGTTLVAAQSLGKHFLGFEQNARYVEICNARLAGAGEHAIPQQEVASHQAPDDTTAASVELVR